MTCTPIGINDHRLLVYGKRIPLKQAEQKHTVSRDTFSPMNIWRDSIILLLILLLIWWLYRWYQDHRDKKKCEEEERQAAEAAKAAAEAQTTDEGTK
jgi:sortase A